MSLSLSLRECQSLKWNKYIRMLTCWSLTSWKYLLHIKEGLNQMFIKLFFIVFWIHDIWLNVHDWTFLTLHFHKFLISLLIGGWLWNWCLIINFRLFGRYGMYDSKFLVIEFLESKSLWTHTKLLQNSLICFFSLRCFLLFSHIIYIHWDNRHF